MLCHSFLRLAPMCWNLWLGKYYFTFFLPFSLLLSVFLRLYCFCQSPSRPRSYSGDKKPFPWNMMKILNSAKWKACPQLSTENVESVLFPRFGFSLFFLFQGNILSLMACDEMWGTWSNDRESFLHSDIIFMLSRGRECERDAVTHRSGVASRRRREEKSKWIYNPLYIPVGNALCRPHAMSVEHTEKKNWIKWVDGLEFAVVENECWKMRLEFHVHETGTSSVVAE